MPSANTKRRNPRKRPTSSPTRFGKFSASGEKPSSNGPEPKSDGPLIYPMNFAGPLRRLYAFMIDLGMIFLVIYTVAPVSGTAMFHTDAAAQDLIFFFGYFVIPTVIWGRTPGKWVAGIVVVDSEGRTPGPAAIPREMIGKFVSIIAGTIGLVWLVFDPKRQGWHDKIAGTFVVENPYSGGPQFMKDFFNLGRKTDTDNSKKDSKSDTNSPTDSSDDKT